MSADQLSIRLKQCPRTKKFLHCDGMAGQNNCRIAESGFRGLERPLGLQRPSDENTARILSSIKPEVPAEDIAVQILLSLKPKTEQNHTHESVRNKSFLQ